jgi:site-specific DNA-methyltransferase (adenine-specific)
MKTNYIKCGDCLELMKEIPDKSIDMILCDLPYGTTACKWDIIIPFDKLWEQYKRIIKDNGCIALFGDRLFACHLRLSNTSWYKYDYYWHKSLGSNFLNLKYQPYFRIETISIFYKKKPTYNPQMYKGKVWGASQRKAEYKNSQGKWNIKHIKFNGSLDGLHYPDNLLEFSNPNIGRKHPTQKPVELLEYLIKTYTNENDLVLDNCMGSGSTGVACINTKRKFIGFELEKKYYDIAKQRISEAISKNNE